MGHRKSNDSQPIKDILIDIAGEDSFPASDPPSRTVVTGVGQSPDELGHDSAHGRRNEVDPNSRVQTEQRPSPRRAE